MKKLLILLLITLLLTALAACKDKPDPNEGGSETGDLPAQIPEELKNVTFPDASFVYDGKKKSVELKNLPQGYTAEYQNNSATDAGEYAASAVVKDSSGKVLASFSAKLTVEPAPFPSRVMFSDTELDYTGSPIYVEARTLEDFLIVTYEGNGVTEPGVYRVTAKFESSNPNYLPPETKTITLTVNDVELPTKGLTFRKDGTAYTVIGYNGTDGDVLVPALYLGAPVTAIAADAFAGNTTVVSVTIRDSVTNVGARAFDGCTSLSSVTLGEGTVNVGSFAFRGCTSLKEMTLPKGLSTVGKSIFANTPLVSLTTPFIGGSALSEKHYLGYFFGAVSYLENELYVPSSLKTVTVCSESGYSIPANAFSLCKDLEKIFLTDGVTEVRNYAFSDCTSLSLVYFGSEVISVPAADIGYNSPFYGCSETLRLCLASSAKPTDAGAYWNYVTLFKKLTPEYGVTLSSLL